METGGAEPGGDAREDVARRLIELAETVGVNYVWLSTVKMSHALGMTEGAIADTLEAIRRAGATIPNELQRLVDQLVRPNRS